MKGQTGKQDWNRNSPEHDRKRYTLLGLRQLKKVTRFFGVVALALLVLALGFAAKHGQFEPMSHHGHFLAKSVKMDTLAHHSDSTPAPVFTVMPLNPEPWLNAQGFRAGALRPVLDREVRPGNFPLPLLV
jgi:hypothetical protein